MEMHPAAKQNTGFNFDNSYLQLPPIFYKKQLATPVKNPSVTLFNDALANALGLNTADFTANASQYLSGNVTPQGAEPLAQAYAGHQFGGFSILGDGRAILLGEHITPNQQRVDIQLKGAGRTPYSRSGDGRAALGPMLREYMISEAMHGLGIPTTRSLAVISTGEDVYREEAYPGAILTRIASSHLRVGTFQFAAATQKPENLKALADYVIHRHFPTIENDYLALLNSVIALQAKLIAQWMQVGFIHGVMNTDNMTISGETIDYGPCAFLNAYHPDRVFSSIDTNGRYAFGNQPQIAHWNLTRLAETLLPLIDESEEKAIELATESLNVFPTQFFDAWLAGFRKKLGIFNAESDDTKLVEDLLMLMQKHQADFTNTFNALADDSISTSPLYAALFEDGGFKNWLTSWQTRLSRQSESFSESVALMHAVNPKVIPRNHLVEAALSAAVNHQDMSMFNELLAVVSNPYADINHAAKYTLAPALSYDTHYKTFCGT